MTLAVAPAQTRLTSSALELVLDDARGSRPLASLPSVDVPVVFQSTWERSGNIAYVFANWSTRDQELRFSPAPYNQRGPRYSLVFREAGARRSLLDRGQLPHDVWIKIAPLSAALVEQRTEQ